MSAPPGWITKTESQQIFNRFRRRELQNHNGAKYEKSHQNVIKGNRVSNSARWGCDFGWKKGDICPDKNTTILEMTLLG